MRTSRALPLLATAALLAGACRDFGDYLSPEQLAACEDGSRQEGCPGPEELAPRATVTFVSPPLLPGEANVAPTGRFIPLSLRVEGATTDVERVDLTCAGLQLASWRPGRSTEAAPIALTGTVDALPCRSASQQLPEADGVVLHRVPLEVVVIDPLGGRHVSRWQLLANLYDATLPGQLGGDGTTAILEVRTAAAATDVLPAGGSFPLEVHSSIALDGAPVVRVDGVRLQADFVGNAERTEWIAQIRGLAPAGDAPPGASAARLMAPRQAVIDVLGTVDGVVAAQRRVYREVGRWRHEFPGSGLVNFWNFPDPSLEAYAPVVTPSGTLVLSDNGSGRIIPQLLSSDDRLLFASVPEPWSAVGLSASGGALLAYAQYGIGPPVMYRALLTDVYGTGSLKELPPSFPIGGLARLGDGRLCGETLSPVQVCGDVQADWAFHCVDPAGDVAIVPVTDGGGDTRLGPAHALVGLAQGWVSYGYAPGFMCNFVPSWQGFSGWGTNVSRVGTRLSSPGFDDMGTASVVTLALVSGSSHAVIGHETDLGPLELERIDAASAQPVGLYFSGVLPSERPRADQVLLARDDGLLLVLRDGGVLEGWRPGAAAADRTVDLTQRLGVTVMDAGRSASPLNVRHARPAPHVRHAADRLTLAFRTLEYAVVIVELDANLEPRWAWSSEPWTLDSSDDFGIYGAPGGAYVDLAIWGMYASRVIRLAR